LGQEEVVKIPWEAASTMGLPEGNFTARFVQKGYAIEGRAARVDKYRKEATEAMVARGSSWVAGTTVPDQHDTCNHDKIGPCRLMSFWGQAAKGNIEYHLIRGTGMHDDEEVDDGAIWSGCE
jgi:hypothetical protein